MDTKCCKVRILVGCDFILVNFLCSLFPLKYVLMVSYWTRAQNCWLSVFQLNFGHVNVEVLARCLFVNEILVQSRYVGGAFDVESLVENLLGQLAANQAILVNVYDITNSSDPLAMYGHQCQDVDMSHFHESKLDFGDPFRKHQMICR